MSVNIGEEKYPLGFKAPKKQKVTKSYKKVWSFHRFASRLTCKQLSRYQKQHLAF